MPSDTFQVGASSDDCYFLRSTEGFSLVVDLFCGDWLSNFYDYESGMRWTVNIPQGSTIISAYLKLVAVGLIGTIPTTIIEGEDVDDAITFSNKTDYMSRDGNRTSANVNWTPSAWVTGTTYTSGNIASIIQEIVNRPSFGTHIVLFWSHALGWGGAAKRLGGASYDHVSYDPPKLEVTWGVVAKPTIHRGLYLVLA